MKLLRIGVTEPTTAEESKWRATRRNGRAWYKPAEPGTFPLRKSRFPKLQ
jgi:hypothetical protein